MGELSTDAGGMLREWMSSLVKILLEPGTGLFIRCDTPQISYTISPNSKSVPEWADKFVLLGKLMGKALFERVALNLCLSPALYKVLLEESLSMQDVKYLDEGVLPTSKGECRFTTRWCTSATPTSRRRASTRSSSFPAPTMGQKLWKS